MKYEYLVLHAAEVSQDRLNETAASGWKLHTVCRGEGTRLTMIFERSPQQGIEHHPPWDSPSEEAPFNIKEIPRKKRPA